MKLLTNDLPMAAAKLGLTVDVGREAFGRGRSHRTLMSVLTALVSAYWVGPYWATAWLAAIAFHEHVFVPTVLQRLVYPNLKTAEKTANAWGAALTAWGAGIYTLGWAPAYFGGGVVIHRGPHFGGGFHHGGGFHGGFHGGGFHGGASHGGGGHR